MIALNHELAGALIAIAVKQPWLAVPLAFGSHFVLDALPHFWIQIKDGNVKARNDKLMFKLVTRTDAVLSLAGIIALPILLHSTANWLLVLGCIVAAALPDFYWVYLYFKDGKTGEQTTKQGFAKFHKDIQWLERPWALPIDILFVIIGVILIGSSI